MIACNFVYRPYHVYSTNASQILTFQDDSRANFSQFSYGIHFLFFELMVIQNMELKLYGVAELFCWSTRNIAPRIPSHDLPYCRTMKRCSVFFPRLVIFLLLLLKSWFRTWFCHCPLSACYAFSLSTSQVFVINILCLSRQFHVIHIHWQE